jgi:uncharacterized protein (DUF924 family)
MAIARKRKAVCQALTWLVLATPFFLPVSCEPGRYHRGMDEEQAEVLGFWFAGIEAGSVDDMPSWQKRVLRWFQGGPELDCEIRERFGALHERAREGALDPWSETGDGLRALVIVFDQFSRNLHRGSPLAFAQDARARALVDLALRRGDDRALDWYERLFLILPLGHSEELADQDRSLAYLESSLVPLIPAALAPLAELNRRQARGHREIIARFGRFPGRNQALGRVSTPEELAYLEEARAAGRPV